LHPAALLRDLTYLACPPCFTFWRASNIQLACPALFAGSAWLGAPCGCARFLFKRNSLYFSSSHVYIERSPKNYDRRRIGALKARWLGWSRLFKVFVLVAPIYRRPRLEDFRSFDNNSRLRTSFFFHLQDKEFSYGKKAQPSFQKDCAPRRT
jgi:hypothetical protein